MQKLSWSSELYEAVKKQKAAKSASLDNETFNKLTASEQKALTRAFQDKNTTAGEDWF